MRWETDGLFIYREENFLISWGTNLTDEEIIYESFDVLIIREWIFFFFFCIEEKVNVSKPSGFITFYYADICI